jgi:hypothetical protein
VVAKAYFVEKLEIGNSEIFYSSPSGVTISICIKIREIQVEKCHFIAHLMRFES